MRASPAPRGMRAPASVVQSNSSTKRPVKGGKTLDQRGGEKLDYSWCQGRRKTRPEGRRENRPLPVREGVDLLDRAGVAGAEAGAPASRGAFRPERKAPRPIAATWRAGLSVDM